MSGRIWERVRRWMWLWGLLGWSVSGWSVEEEVLELEPYKVEAWHFDELGERVPADVTRVERDELEAHSGAGVPELLEALAGVQFSDVTGNGTQGQLSMRGFGENSGLRVLVQVDGQSYNPADMGGVNWLGMDVAGLEAVEVIRGGQSVLYGNHALSGVVKIETRLVEEGVSGGVQLQAGDHGTIKAGASWGQGFGGNAVRIGVQREISDGYREHSGYENHGIQAGGRIQLKAAGTWEGRLSWNQSDMYFPGPLDYAGMLEDPRQSSNSGDEHSLGESLLGSVKGSEVAPWGEWQVQGGFLKREQKWKELGRNSENRLDRFNLSPRVRIGSERRSLIMGLDYQADALDFLDLLDAEERVVRSHAELDRDTMGGYVFWQNPITEQLALSGGVRAEHARTDNLNIHYKENQLLPYIETNRGTFPNPDYRDPPEVDPLHSFDGVINKSGWAAEVSLIAQPVEGLSVWAGWDRVYRYPSLDEAAAYQGYPLSEPLNSQLDPETGNNFEVGVKRQTVNWNASLTGFALLLENEIVYDGEARLNTNVGKTERLGVEMELAVHREKYGLATRLSWTQARMDTVAAGGQGDVPLVSRYYTVANLWVQIMGSVRLYLGGTYRSSQYQGNDFENQLRKLPAYGLVDCSIRWKLSEATAVHLGVNNVLDRRYASTAFSGGYYPGSGRSASLRLNSSF